MKTGKWSIQKLIYTAMLAAVAGVLMSLEFSVPMMPPFYKVDFSDVPSVIAVFLMGPVSGICVEVIKLLIKLITVGTNTMYVGELANLIAAFLFVWPLWFLYQKLGANRKAAVEALLLSIVIRTACACFINANITLPLYAKAMSLPLGNRWESCLGENPGQSFLFDGTCKDISVFIRGGDTMIRNYRDLTRWEMEQVDRENTIVLIPLGALEQHGNQAPLGTDDIIAEAMSQEIKKALEAEGEEDFPMLLFPVIPVGLSTEHKNFCGSVTVRPDTYYHLLYDICVSLAHHGFKKLAFLVCHGGNAPIAQVLSRELRSELGIAPFILSAGAFGHPDVKATISKGNIWDFHGGEMETSMVMAVDESLVKLELSEAGEPTAFERPAP